MKLFGKLFSKKTYIKYFLSYLILFTVLILGFFFIIRNQITSQYFKQQSTQAKNQLDLTAEQLNDDLIFLSQLDNSIKRNTELIQLRYKEDIPNRQQTYQELIKYISSTKLISSIIYLPKTSDFVISTEFVVKYQDGIFDIKPTEYSSISFDPAVYYNATFGQLIFISNEDLEYLLYFPSISSESNYVFFYVLDTSNIKRQLKSLTSDEMPAIALIDGDRQFVVDVNGEQLLPYIDSFALENGIYELDSSTSICVHTGISNEFTMIALISNDSLTNQINAVFGKTYLTLMLLSMAGILLILLAMRITYLPLHRLTQKIVENSDSKIGYLEQLDSAFSQAARQNQLLKDKLDNYRLSMQKSLLDSIVNSQPTNQITPLPNIDHFFDTASTREIFAIRMSAVGKVLPSANIWEYFQQVLPGKDSCIILETKKNSAVFLINYIGSEQNKDDVLKELLINFYEEQGYLSAISNGTDSPLDIPSLYENVMRASNSWPDVPVVDYKTLPPDSTYFAYPYGKLNQLSDALTNNDFAASRKYIDELFQIIDRSQQTNNNFPDFFVRSILIDMLTAIINCMSKTNIKFDSYSDLYFKTLYFSRSYSYADKEQVIKQNTDQLISFYEQEFSSRIINPAQIRQMIGDAYCQPDFSISILADKFHVSIAYMSYLIKKELNQNFSEYLWSLRLEKAKELLKQTKMSIDEISITVGYFNTSSFRRKFKQETGRTPSQYRTEDAE